MRLFILLIGSAFHTFSPNCIGQELYETKNDFIVRSLDESYQRGLNYLASTQDKDGKWSASSYGDQAGVVGMAILSFISRGDDPEFGNYSIHIQNALDGLLRMQNLESGFIGTTMYNHGFATLALAELYGVLNDERIGPALNKAVSLITSSAKSNPKNAWRYLPDSTDSDTTVSGTQIVALLAARNAGIDVPESVIDEAINFMTSCQDEQGGFGYTTSTGSNLPRTAIGSLVLSITGKVDSEAYKKSVGYLKKNAPYGDQGHKFYSLYYTAQAVFRADPQFWNQWNEKNVRELLDSQQDDGSWRGNHGQAFCTCAALLSMALNYRYLPIYER